MADNQQQQIDHYDFINAPQFVDFDDLASHDDPQADKFFETHREEDDFTIPHELDINNISPTVQLLYTNDNEHYSNEANKAAMEAGLEDVKIEYYASPQSQASKSLSQPTSGKKSFNSMYGTPMGGSGCSSGVTSFYTPTGGDDKENLTPASSKKKSDTQIKQISDGKQVALETNKEKEGNNGQRSILSERAIADISSLSNYSPAAKMPNNQSVHESMMSVMQKLTIVSSDEDDENENNSESMPVPYPQQPAKSPGKPSGDMESAAKNFSTFDESKMAFLGLSGSGSKCNRKSHDFGSDDESCSDHGEKTLLCNSSVVGKGGNELGLEDIPCSPIEHHVSDSEEEEHDKSAPMEMDTPVKNILKTLEDNLRLDIDGQDFEDGPRYSILVAPSVGQQVHWDSESMQQHDVHMTGRKVDGVGLNVSYQVGAAAYDDETDDEFGGVIFVSEASSRLSNRRASSVGDLVGALEPRNRDFKSYGYNPRFGITIPKTPDCVESERRACQEEPQPGPSQLEAFTSNKNACYFEIEPPKPSMNLRRVSSCSELLKLNTLKAKPAPKRKPFPKKPLTIPRTPEAVKRSQQKMLANQSIISNASCESVNANRKPGTIGSSVADRLAAAKSRAAPMKGSHYVSMAEALVNYQKNTPDRFRSLPRGRTQPEKRSASSDSRKRASPSPYHSPEPANRSRADTFSKTTKGTNSGLPKKVELKPTIPKPFNFSSMHRQKPAVPKEDTVDFKFKARPAPSKAQHENPAAKFKSQVKVTQPMSPRFASDERLRERHQRVLNATMKSPEPKQTKPKLQQKTSRIPTSSRAHAEDHKTTMMQPFSSGFDARQKEIVRKKEEKIKQEKQLKGKVPEFRANPVPKFSGKLPTKKPVEATHVEPFRLKSDERGAAYQDAFKRKLEEEEQQLKEQAVFHAQPADVIHKPPFEPERPTRVIEPHEIQLATEKRAEEREQFDEHLREKEREEEERRQEEQERLEELQILEDIERRRQMVHKAQPFKPPKAFELKASDKALTVPQSPAFSALPSERRTKSASSPPPHY